MRTSIALVDCYICGRQDYGPAGAPVCLTCIAEESHSPPAPAPA